MLEWIQLECTIVHNEFPIDVTTEPWLYIKRRFCHLFMCFFLFQKCMDWRWAKQTNFDGEWFQMQLLAMSHSSVQFRLMSNELKQVTRISYQAENQNNSQMNDFWCEMF